MDVSAIPKQPLLFFLVSDHNDDLSCRFCTVLDGAKTGKTLLQDKYSQDRNNETYGIRYTPPWKEMERDHSNTAQSSSSSILLSRQSLPPFVMDVLCEAAQHIKDECLKQIEERFNSLPKVKDLDLIAPWQDAEAHMKDMLSSPEQNIRIVGEAHKTAMESIKAHVARVNDFSAKLINSTRNPGGGRASTGCVGVDVGAAARSGKSKIGKRRGGADFSHRSIETRQDCLRRVSREFVGGPPAAETYVFSQEEVGRLRASYAYLYDWMKHGGGTRFPWNVAFDELGEIKLRAHKDFKPISRDFYEKMSIRKI
jgi:RNA-dependent RNA polymerase